MIRGFYERVIDYQILLIEREAEKNAFIGVEDKIMLDDGSGDAWDATQVFIP